ncbi:6,7-dimethyl-8-ribityllumazine synthase [Tardiphaga sp. 71_E8_N1_1]|jgi:6,7-dimethyl-8-ribityllumazine synthase|uniref:6,7-dimethyl-8-ribityllumazine synthase n=1 Tax=Tardiphaga sp. 71_E8_N1_1 TaxID=3240784 RepID=UPI003F8C4A3E
MNDTTSESSAVQHPRFAKPQRVAFVQSSWHRDIVAPCWESFLSEIEVRHISPSQVDLFEVPGSFEIPLHVQVLAKTRRYTAIVAAGLVVDSGTRGFVADTVIRALMDVQLRTEIPVFSAVTAPEDFHETEERTAFFRKHFAESGLKVAAACAETLLSLERLRGQVAAGIV